MRILQAKDEPASSPAPADPGRRADPTGTLAGDIVARLNTTAPSTRPGMGSTPHADGTTFRVWAPHADAVFVTGTFDDWAGDRTTLRPRRRRLERDVVGRRRRASSPAPSTASRSGRRTATCRGWTRTPGTSRTRSATASSTTRPRFDWGDDEFQMPRPGTTSSSTRSTSARSRRRSDRTGTFDAARRRLPYLRKLGVVGGPGDAAVRVRRRHLVGLQPGPPVRDRVRLRRAGRVQALHPRRARSTASPSSSTSSTTTSARRTSTCGGSTAGPRATAAGSTSTTTIARVTPWGATRPDYGRGEVRTFLRDSALTWLEEFRCDGLRFDATRLHPDRGRRSVATRPRALPDGWSFLAWVNDEIRARQPWKITIAEDLEDDPLAGRRRPPRAAPGSAPSGTPGSSAASGRRSSTPDDARARHRRGRGGRSSATAAARR